MRLFWRVIALNIAVLSNVCAMSCNSVVEHRITCGYFKIAKPQCENLGCCYDQRLQSCFLAQADSSPSETTPEDFKKDTCNFGHNRIRCGYFGIDQYNCEKRGCCWKKGNYIWENSCFLPQENYQQHEIVYSVLGNSGHPTDFTPSKAPTMQPTTEADRITNKEQNSTENDIFSLLKLLEIDFTLTNASKTTPRQTALQNISFNDNTNQNNSLDLDDSFVLPDLLNANATSDGHSVKTLLRMLMQLHEFNDTTDNQKMCPSINSISCCEKDPTLPCCEFDKPRNETTYKPRTRIVGGAPAGYLKKSMAYLTKPNYQSQFCGGTLINKAWVVTAAHCVLEYCTHSRSPRDIIVKFGKTDKPNYVWEKRQVQTRHVGKVFCHANNCKSASNPRLNDIALLRLIRPVYFTIYVKPALLPKFRETPIDESNCVVLGWGDTLGTSFSSKLKQVTVPYYTNEICNLPEYRNCGIRACMLCAGALGKDPCEGDSGGPLFCPNNNGIQVFQGVYSWGRCGTERNKPAVYARISYYTAWITKLIS